MNTENNQNTWLWLVVVLVVIVVAFILYKEFMTPVVSQPGEEVSATTSEESTENTQATTSENTETESTEGAGGEQETANSNIHVSVPNPQATISGDELVISGEASGWYFEGSFGVVLKSQNGTVLAQVPATAQGDWMTTAFVPFEATIDLSGISYTGPASLVFVKANPSGMPQNAASVTIPVVIQ